MFIPRGRVVPSLTDESHLLLLPVEFVAGAELDTTISASDTVCCTDRKSDRQTDRQTNIRQTKNDRRNEPIRTGKKYK